MMRSAISIASIDGEGNREDSGAEFEADRLSILDIFNGYTGNRATSTLGSAATAVFCSFLRGEKPQHRGDVFPGEGSGTDERRSLISMRRLFFANGLRCATSVLPRAPAPIYSSRALSMSAYGSS